MRITGRTTGVPVFVTTAMTLIALAISIPTSNAQRNRDLSGVHARVEKQVRHELLMLPYYSVFDSLQFQVTGTDTVVLTGQVTQPTLKRDAEKAVKEIEGIGNVVNRIEVLPLSPNDDRLRLATYRAIFSRPGLEKYAIQAVPPIHIIVKNGNVRLLGVVLNQMDKDIAGMAAKGVPGAFKVTNELTVEKRTT